MPLELTYTTDLYWLSNDNKTLTIYTVSIGKVLVSCLAENSFGNRTHSIIIDIQSNTYLYI